MIIDNFLIFDHLEGKKKQNKNIVIYGQFL